ncbi:MAG: two component transcriptional regulator, winged helix family [Rhodocyclaceae bacterium]|nr:two component transcriptional regulator, winged helix family [Rhodocyclaceae bacterium]
MPHLLLADDDHDFCALLERYLKIEGFDIALAHDGETALALALSGNFDLIVLDIMMPGISGLEVLRRLRPLCRTPVLMLTALGEDADSLRGFELGADDYLGKPCNLKVLLARIRAVLRRSEQVAAGCVDDGVQICVDDLSVNTHSLAVKCRERPVDLTSTEFAILESLLRSAGQVVAKAALSEKALRRPLGRFDRSLDMHISNLRQKLGPLPNGNERIKTIRGVGYQYLTE